MGEKRKIDYLSIAGFLSIKRLDRFPLHELNILIGANGAGKSNFISYFRMLSEMVEGRLQQWVSERGGGDRLLTYGIKKLNKSFHQLNLGTRTYQFTLGTTVTSYFVFQDERIYYKEDGIKAELPLGSGHRELALELYQHPNSLIAKSCYDMISNLRIFHFHDTSDTAYVKRKRELQDNRYLRSDASNLPAYLYMLKQRHPDIYQQIRSTVQLAIPFFDDFILVPEEVRPDEFLIQLLWQQKNSDYPFLPSQLSDGSIRFICLTTALLQPNPPSTLIFDEPELGLHPYAITLLGSLMRSASQDMQIIVSTQSVALLNEFSIADLVVVEREDGVSTFKRLNETEFSAWLEDYSIGELWEKNVLGGRP